MEEKPATAEPRRRWYQFRLRTLLVGTTLLAIPCGYVGWQAKIVRERKACRERMKDFAFWFDNYLPDSLKRPSAKIPWLRKQLGDNAVMSITLFDGARDQDIEEMHAMFPEAAAIEVVVHRTPTHP